MPSIAYPHPEERAQPAPEGRTTIMQPNFPPVLRYIHYSERDTASIANPQTFGGLR